MKATYTWLLYSCLFFESSILCDKKLDKRQAVSSCSVSNGDMFYCSNGLCIEWSWVCDGRNDCSDGSDETKQLCARYEYGTNKTTSCGKLYGNNDEWIDNGEKSRVGTAPWNVKLYNTKNGKYTLKSSGSIIAPNVVISSSEGLWTNRDWLTDELIELNDTIVVAVGKYNSNILMIDNVIGNEYFAQIIKVEQIYLPESYFGLYGLYAEDIAVIVLKQNVLFSNNVAPVCVDWNSIYNVNNGDQGKVVVRASEFATEGPVLLDTFVQYISLTNCRKMYSDGFLQRLTFDKFCADIKMAVESLKISENTGSGISFLHDNSYYLTGIMSQMDDLVNHTVIAFTDIKYHVQWIRRVLDKHFTEKLCVLPTVEGVVYSFEASDEILSHGTLINNTLTVIENCEVGYHKAYSHSFRICMGKGKWSSNSKKLCFKMCPPLESDSSDIKCSYNGKYANCSNLLIPNTIATPSCKPSYYTASNGQDENPLELLCQSDGTWNNQLYRCNPYCGKEYIINQVSIDNGKKAPVGTAPWNVGVYQLNKTNSNYDWMCGGSIISSKIVVSAAHCFWQKGMLSNIISVNDGIYKIAVGKYDKNFTINDNEFTQIVNIEMIHLNEGYNGSTGFHADDIAIIVLQNRVSFSSGVAPVCIDWNGKYNVVNGNQGKIVGWGKTEKDISCPILLEASLPYIDHSSCRNMSINGFEPYVTVDKFCANFATDPGQVGDGYSGAGLCFFHPDSYYLTGLVSIKDPKINNSIAVFTEVKYHMQWIRKLHNKHN